MMDKDKIIIALISIYLCFSAIKAIVTGEATTFIGPGVAAIHNQITYQENTFRFILEITVRLTLGGGGIIAVFTKKK